MSSPHAAINQAPWSTTGYKIHKQILLVNEVWLIEGENVMFITEKGC